MSDNWLRDYGFNTVLLPRRDIHPADVLYRAHDDFDAKVGDLSMVFGSPESIPPSSSGEPVADIGRSVERKFELNFGLKILAGLFGASASDLGAKLEGQHTSTLKVTYED